MAFDAIYCFDRASVLFAIYPNGPEGPRVVAEISEDALRDIFGARGGGSSLVEACRNHFDLIEEAALQRCRHAPGKPVTLKTRDFDSPCTSYDPPRQRRGGAGGVSAGTAGRPGWARERQLRAAPDAAV